MIDLSNIEGATYSEWCSFCNAEPACGEVEGMFPLGINGALEFHVLKIGSQCLSRAEEKQIVEVQS